MKRKISIILSLVLVVLLLYVGKRVFIGYQRSGVAKHFNEIKELDTLGLQDIFDVNYVGNSIKYKVETGYMGRAHLTILLEFKTTRKDFINIVLHDLKYEQVEENWWHGKNKNEIGVVKKIGSRSDKESYLSNIKKEMSYFLKGKNVSVDDQDFSGDRTFETSNRYISLSAVFDIDNNIVIFAIQSSFLGN